MASNGRGITTLLNRFAKTATAMSSQRTKAKTAATVTKSGLLGEKNGLLSDKMDISASTNGFFERKKGSENKRMFTVTVEGNIGAGKTTFLDRFCPEKDNVDVLSEPVDR